MQQAPRFSPLQIAATSRQWYGALLKRALASARKRVDDEQHRYRREKNDGLRRSLPKYADGDYDVVKREALLGEEERFSADVQQSKLAPCTEGPFRVVAIDDSTVTLICARLDDRVLRYRLRKAPLKKAGRISTGLRDFVRHTFEQFGELHSVRWRVKRTVLS